MSVRLSTLVARAALIAAVFSTAPALAKEYAFRSPTGREIYTPEDRFGDAINQRGRRFVVEVATGAGPEGNLAMLLGALNVGARGFELYAGVGLELNPAVHYTGTARYYIQGLGSFRPYGALGYLLNDTHAIGVISHNAFAEIGHKWVLHRTYHLTLGAGVRWVGSVVVQSDSTLRAGDVDQELLEQQIDDVMPRWLPTIALRFSRAF